MHRVVAFLVAGFPSSHAVLLAAAHPQRVSIPPRMLQDRTFLSALPSSSLELGSVLTQSMDEPLNTTKLPSLGIFRFRGRVGGFPPFASMVRRLIDGGPRAGGKHPRLCVTDFDWVGES